MNLITVKSSHYQTDLLVLKSRLESEGISCYLKNELTSQILPHVPAFIVELQVKNTDVEQVKNIMLEMGETLENGVTFVCDSCGSDKLKMKLSFIKRIQIFFSVLFNALGSNAPTDKLFKQAEYICRDCGEIKQF